MSVNVCLPLFGAPVHELEADKNVSGRQLRTLADELRERLLKAAEVLDKLKAAGWNAHVAMYEVGLTHAGVETREQAEQLLRANGVEPSLFMIVEEIDEETE